MNGHHQQLVQSFYLVLKSEEISLAVLIFEQVKKAVSSIFSMANNEKNKIHLFNVGHCHQPCGQPQHCVVFILTQAITKYYI
jgi:hypothetical protein